ncbi:MAG: hypothetical protein JNG89_04400 [Planctomycetaceae bacterium]|nr:hypothetical protein [Planctomycetaceae bacterium]
MYHSRRNNGMTVLARNPEHALDFAVSDPIPSCLSNREIATTTTRSAGGTAAAARIDCFLTVYEQLTWPRRMAEQCVRLGLNPIIVDNGSTYEPLLAWLENCPYEVIRVGANAGCYGFWHRKHHHARTDLYVVSDSDLDLSAVPADAVDRLRRALDQNPDVAKAGLSLEIIDLPDVYPFKQDVVSWEQQFWTTRRGDCWRADIGATFALYDPSRNALLDQNFYPAVRLDRPYTARHLPWYLDFNDLTDELRYYFSRCDDLAHWGSRTKRRLQESNP